VLKIDLLPDHYGKTRLAKRLIPIGIILILLSAAASFVPVRQLDARLGAVQQEIANGATINTNVQTEGTAESGSTTSLKDGNRKEEARTFEGCEIKVTGADGQERTTKVKTFANSEFTFEQPLATPVAPRDSYAVVGQRVAWEDAGAQVDKLTQETQAIRGETSGVKPKVDFIESADSEGPQYWAVFDDLNRYFAQDAQMTRFRLQGRGGGGGGGGGAPGGMMAPGMMGGGGGGGGAGGTLEVGFRVQGTTNFARFALNMARHPNGYMQGLQAPMTAGPRLVGGADMDPLAHEREPFDGTITISEPSPGQYQFPQVHQPGGGATATPGAGPGAGAGPGGMMMPGAMGSMGAGAGPGGGAPPAAATKGGGAAKGGGGAKGGEEESSGPKLGRNREAEAAGGD